MCCRVLADGSNAGRRIEAVVDETTTNGDQAKRRDACANGGIPIYWIVYLVNRRVEVYVDPRPAG
jgi:hypothetical protein